MKSIFLSLLLVSATATAKELKIGISQEFENLNPLISTMAATSYLQGFVYRGLVRIDPDAKWQTLIVKEIPSLANKKLKLVDNPKGGKGMIATWEIIEAAKWGDGTPVTCKDIAFATEVGKNDNVSVGERESYQNVTKIDIDPKNPKICDIHYENAKWDVGRQTPGPLPVHIEGPIFQKFKGKKEGYDQNSNYTKNPSNPGLYNGPYVVKEIKLGSHISFAVNPHFYGKKPTIESIIVKVIPNTATLEANLRSGTIDKIASLGLAFDQAIAFEKKVKSENLPYAVMTRPSLVYEHIDFNLDNPILSDIKVRQAMMFAVNRDELTKALFDGRQPVALHSIAKNDDWYVDDPKKIKTYSFSRREAMKLLDQAGWKMGADGIRTKDGKRLSLNFGTTAGNKTRETVQTFLQNQWKAVGIEVIIKNEPARVFFAETTKKRKFDLAMYAWVSSQESSPRSTMHSSNIPSEKNSYSGQNQPGWKNAEVDKLIDQLEMEFDADKRKELSNQITKHYTEDLPVLPLYYRSDVAVTPTALKNYRLPGNLFSETLESENWTF